MTHAAAVTEKLMTVALKQRGGGADQLFYVHIRKQPANTVNIINSIIRIIMPGLDISSYTTHPGP